MAFDQPVRRLYDHTLQNLAAKNGDRLARHHTRIHTAHISNAQKFALNGSDDQPDGIHMSGKQNALTGFITGAFL